MNQRLEIEAPGKSRHFRTDQEPSKASPPHPHVALRILRGVWSHRWRVASVIAALGAGIYAVPFLLFGPLIETRPVVRANFVQTVVASGHVEAPFRINIGSQITGVVANVPVSEGQTVKAGDTLIELDDRDARAAVSQAENVVSAADARMRQLRELSLPQAEEALKQAQANLVNAQQSFDRAQALAKDGFGTQAALDDATKSLDVAKAQARNAEFQVATNRPGGSDYTMSEMLLNQSTANLASARSRLSYTVISAPRDGTLISRSVEKGNVVEPSNVLMKLAPFGDTQLVVQIDERNLGLLALGQKAIASADAYPKQSFPAEVVYINPGVNLQTAAVEVKLGVKNPPSYLREDMTISVDIAVAEHPNTLIIPAACLRNVDIEPFVLKIDGGRVKRQRVKVGIVSDGKAEILDGLSVNDLIVPTTVPSDYDGRRVRAKIAAPSA